MTICSKCGGDPKGLHFSKLMLLTKLLIISAMAMPFIVQFSGMYDVFGEAAKFFPIFKHGDDPDPSKIGQEYFMFTHFSYIPAIIALVMHRRSTVIPSLIAAVILLPAIILPDWLGIIIPLFIVPAVLYAASAVIAVYDKKIQLKNNRIKYIKGA